MPNDSIIHDDSGSPGDGRASAATGLTAEGARRRLAEDGPDLLPGGQPRTWLSIASETMREPMFLLLLTAGTLYVPIAGMALLPGALYLPWAVGVPRFAPLSGNELAAACAPGLLSVLWFEGVKWMRRPVVVRHG